MVRPLRIEYPGAYYHVINRGQRQEAIFDDDRDRERFLLCLERMVNLFGVRVHTYCLMTNHYHLILETPEANLSRAMQWFNVSYAVYYNRRHQYTGHLFQGRFKAILIEADTYLESLSRYIHLNPVRVGVVQQAWKYRWSSCRYFVTAAKPPNWLDIRRVLTGFGRSAKTQRTRYREYLLDSDPDIPSQDVVGGLLLGSEAFMEWAKDTFLSTRKRDRQLPVLDRLRPRPALEDIVGQVAKYWQVQKEHILKSGAKRNLPRDVAIYLAREMRGCSGRELGEYFGAITGAGISVRCKHIEKVLATDRNLRRDIKNVRAAFVNS